MSLKLERVKPAQNYLILNSVEMDIKIIFKLTLIDLMLSKVLKIKVIEEQYETEGEIKIAKYCELSRGDNFENYVPVQFEMPFLEIFHTFSDASIALNQFIRIVARRIKRPKAFVSQLLNNSPLSNYYEQNIFQRIFGKYSVSEEGKKYKKLLVAEIDQISDLIYTSDNQKNIKLIKDLMTFHGIVLLLNQEAQDQNQNNDLKVNDVNERYLSTDFIRQLIDNKLTHLAEIFKNLEISFCELTENDWSDLGLDLSVGGVGVGLLNGGDGDYDSDGDGGGDGGGGDGGG